MTAPVPRTDLPWLRRRTPVVRRLDRPAATPPRSPAPAASSPAPSSPAPPSLTLSSRAPTGAAPTGPPPSRPTPPTPTPASAPAAWSGGALDLSRPSPGADAPGPTAPGPAAPAPTAPGPGPARPAPARPTPPRPGTQPASRPTWRRVAAGGTVELGPDAPTVALTRVQSGVGALTAELVAAVPLDGVRLGFAWQSGATTGWADGERGSRSGVVLEPGHGPLSVDLYLVRPLRRLAVVVWGEQPGERSARLVVRTAGGARVDVALPGLRGGEVRVAVTGHVVSGELLLRAERTVLTGGPAHACDAFGYDLRWLDPFHVVT